MNLQVNHASDVWVLGKAEPESYDAMVTDQPGVVLAAPGADCMPILFADPVPKVIAAAHAGGRFMHVSPENIQNMKSQLFQWRKHINTFFKNVYLLMNCNDFIFCW